MTTVYAYNRDEGMPVRLFLLENGTAILADEDHPMEEIVNVDVYQYIGRLGDKLRPATVAACLGCLTEHIYDRHDRAVAAAVRRLRRWFGFTGGEELHLRVSSVSDGGEDYRLIIEDKDRGTVYVSEAGFDEDSLTVWARRYVDALVELYGLDIKVSWKLNGRRQ